MFQPRRRGRMTLWPRLETGKSSETPWSRPRTTACQYEIRLASGIASAPRVCRLLPAGREPRGDDTQGLGLSGVRSVRELAELARGTACGAVVRTCGLCPRVRLK